MELVWEWEFRSQTSTDKVTRLHLLIFQSNISNEVTARVYSGKIYSEYLSVSPSAISGSSNTNMINSPSNPDESGQALPEGEAYKEFA